VLKSPQSKRWRAGEWAVKIAERLECGRFITAFSPAFTITRPAAADGFVFVAASQQSAADCIRNLAALCRDAATPKFRGAMRVRSSGSSLPIALIGKAAGVTCYCAYRGVTGEGHSAATAARP
jgi:hypothetical protein